MVLEKQTGKQAGRLRVGQGAGVAEAMVAETVAQKGTSQRLLLLRILHAITLVIALVSYERNTQTEKTHRARWGRGTELPCPLQVCHSPRLFESSAT